MTPTIRKAEAPRDQLIRAIHPGVELRTADDGDTMPTLFGHFAVFDRWAEIHSWLEGDFLERMAPGAFAKTIRENRDNVKVLYDHGFDFHVGNKVLGPIDQLREDEVGPYYEVPLLDTSYNRDLVPGLEAGLYGASFRFRVVKDEWDEEPGRSDHNPNGLPERTIREVRLYEFGPVTFPAYDDATAGVRSLTDRFLDRALEDPATRERLNDRLRTPHDEGAARQGTPDREGAASESTDEPAAGHSTGLSPRERREALFSDLLVKE